MTPSASAVAPGPMGLMRLVARFNLHPQASLHPSWLPPGWPARARPRLARLAPEAQEMLRKVLVEQGILSDSTDYAFDSPLKRLLLLDPASLRRLAFYTSLCVHLPLMRPRRCAVGSAMRRQARRFGKDVVDFVLERAPELSELQMSSHSLKERPAGCGKLLVDRGYRLLMAVLADEGEAVTLRLAQMFPIRAAELPVPQLTPRQKAQLRELMLACIVPERFAQWDWLF